MATKRTRPTSRHRIPGGLILGRSKPFKGGEAGRSKKDSATALPPGARQSPPEGAVPRAAAPLLIVGVGASAGGLEAFTQLLKALPVDTGMGFVLVQHLDPKHESALTQILERTTAMPVREVADNLRVKANHVYVIPPNTFLSIARGVLRLQPRKGARTPPRSIDHFFEALAEDQRERAIGVILSGTASDGTLGLAAIKAEGGLTFAQDDTARYDSMPRSAVAAGCVDYILDPRGIAEEIARIAKHPAVGRQITGLPAEADRSSATEHQDDETPLPSGGRGSPRTGARRVRDEAGSDQIPRGSERDLRRIQHLLRNHSGVDFSLYKSPTFQRRMTRRMVLNQQDTLGSYADFLLGNTRELDALYSDALVSVTSFFRSPEAFDVLQRKVIPKLLARRSDAPVRVWVLGCSTGQEAYSVAMAFQEGADNARHSRRLQVFATDLNEALLSKARHGLYAKSLAQDISPKRLRRFFVEEEGGYRVVKALREIVVFARQNLIGDPPFSRMDLISCRNLLIYLDPSMHAKAFPTFHYALRPDGFLFLGASESIGSFTDLFEPVDKKWKIYCRKPGQAALLHLPVGKDRSGEGASERTPSKGNRGAGPRPTVEPSRFEPTEGFRSELNAQREADRVAANAFAPPGVVINDDLQILQFRGSTRLYLQPPSGKASLDLLKMAVPGLMLPLRAAINAARRTNKAARKERVQVGQNGETRTLNVQVIPLKSSRDRCYLVLFEDAGKAGLAGSAARESPPRGRTPRRTAALQAELSETRAYLQAVQEEHEGTNEELQASNEEIQSANEELQSINEELETSKEELESANEELTTVNHEMDSRNAELSRLYNDLLNVQTSIKLAIVLLGRDLTIRRFSAQAEKKFHLKEGDVGRPLGDIRHDLVIPDLEALVSEVIDSVREQEREVQDQEGCWFSLRLRPYLTHDNKVDGAVLVLVDINDLKRTMLEIAAARDYAQTIVRTVPDPLVILNADLRVDTASDAFYRTFRVSMAETEGKRIYDLGNGQWDIPRLRQLLEEILPQHTTFTNFEITHDFDTLGRRTMLVNARAFGEAPGQEKKILLGIHDVTDSLRLEASERLSLARNRALVEASAQIFWTADASGAAVEDSPTWRAFTGQTYDEWKGAGWIDAIHPDDRDRFLESWKRAVADRTPLSSVCRVRLASGDHRWTSVRAVPVLNPDDTVREWVGMNNDITERKLAEEALRRSDRSKDEFLAMLSHELRNPLAALSNAVQLLGVERGDDSQTQLQARGIMERQMRQLQHLVSDLLEVSRITSGRVHLRQERIPVNGIVESAVETIRSLVAQRSQELTIALPEDPIWLDADAARLEQVLVNLLTNAAKYTEKNGHIWLTVEKERDECVVRVRDTGVGISSELLPNIFDLFTQGSRTMDRSQGGLGVGLTIVKRLTELHGGRVEALSTVAEGSEFAVRLPIATDAFPPPSSKAESVQPFALPLRILVVDDSVDTALGFEILLTEAGHEVRSVHDGPAAVPAALDFRPDVVVLDIGLPGLNGYQVAKQMRQEPVLEGVVLVALTGYGQEADRRTSFDAGFDYHLVKPAGLKELHQILAAVKKAQ